MLDDGVLGDPYDQDIPVEQDGTAVAGVASVELASGSAPLPEGLTLDAGAISGTPTESGSFVLDVRASGNGTQCSAPSDTFTVQLVIAPGGP